MDYCLYFQATIERKNVWLFTSIIRSFEHLAFDRTLDKQKSIFEFFVPHGLEGYFLEIMNELSNKGLVHDMQQLPNRLADT